MKIRTQEIYNCEHCNKLYLRKKSCETHEKYCMKNEANTPKCFECDFLVKDIGSTTEEYGEGFEPAHFRCKKKENVMHPIKIQRKIDTNSFWDGKIKEFLEDSESELMPKECDLFESEKIYDNPF